MLRGHLLSYGLCVQQKRIRESLRRIDPEGCALRWFESIHRRTYTVPHSQALWHIDSNHKLIRYVCMPVYKVDMEVARCTCGCPSFMHTHAVA